MPRSLSFDFSLFRSLSPLSHIPKIQASLSLPNFSPTIPRSNYVVQSKPINLCFCGLKREALGFSSLSHSDSHRVRVSAPLRSATVSASASSPANGSPPKSFDYDLLIIGTGVGGHGATLHATVTREKGFAYTVVLMSEISPPRIALFEDSVDAWIQIACPRLSIDLGDAFKKPLLNPFEADIALGLIPGWWDKTKKNDVGCCGCAIGNGAAAGEEEAVVGDYPMDYYALDGGEWNSSYVNKPSRPLKRDCASATAANIK